MGGNPSHTSGFMNASNMRFQGSGMSGNVDFGGFFGHHVGGNTRCSRKGYWCSTFKKADCFYSKRQVLHMAMLLKLHTQHQSQWWVYDL